MAWGHRKQCLPQEVALALKKEVSREVTRESSPVPPSSLSVWACRLGVGTFGWGPGVGAGGVFRLQSQTFPRSAWAYSRAPGSCLAATATLVPMVCFS